jgi:hypothetical protein
MPIDLDNVTAKDLKRYTPKRGGVTFISRDKTLYLFYTWRIWDVRWWCTMNDDWASLALICIGLDHVCSLRGDQEAAQFWRDVGLAARVRAGRAWGMPEPKVVRADPDVVSAKG